MDFLAGLLSGFYDNLLPFLILILVLVSVHEWGHYIVARLCGVTVETFSIGFGPELYAWVAKSGTRWRIAALPLGGYVKMLGDEDPASATSNGKKLTKKQLKSAFFTQPLWKRASIVAAGPGVNFLFAILALAVLFMIQGQPYTPVVVKEVMKQSAAAEGGIIPGDVITHVDGEEIDRFEELQKIVRHSAGQPLNVTVMRGEGNVALIVTPGSREITDRFGDKRQIGVFGIRGGKPKLEQRGPISALYHATIETYALSAATLNAFGDMIMGTRSSEEIGGPIRIAQMSSEVKQEGWLSFLWFMAILSINLGLINLFPIPVLDGGHLLFYAIEAVMGKPVNEKMQEYMVKAGLTVILALVVLSTWNDLSRLEYIKNLVAS